MMAWVITVTPIIKKPIKSCIPIIVMGECRKSQQSARLSISMMKCQIKWRDFTQAEWAESFSRIAQSTITQSYIYAQAFSKLEKINVRHGVIMINDKEAGIVQIFEASLFFKAIHAVIIDRAPLWFTGHGSMIEQKLFYDVLNKEFPARFGRKRRLLPEMEQSNAGQAMLIQCGWRLKEETTSYQTLWWDLSQPVEGAQKNLSKGWAGSLKKAQTSDIDIEWDDDLCSYSLFKEQYLKDKKNKAYEGLSPQLLDNLAAFSTKDFPIIIGNAKRGHTVIASVLFLLHGRSATYQIGWTSEAGRKYCAHHLLLWQCRDILSRYGIDQLDLGGIHDHNEGLSRFKKGTGAAPVTLAGHYC